MNRPAGGLHDEQGPTVAYSAGGAGVGVAGFFIAR
jgi:hypothetical protein